MTTTAAQPFALVPSEVSDAGKFVQQTADQLVSGIRSADTDVKALEGTWSGQAARAYAAGWEESRAAAVKVLEALTTMGELLGVTVAQLSSTDDRHAGDIGAVTSSLNLP